MTILMFDNALRNFFVVMNSVYSDPLYLLMYYAFAISENSKVLLSFNV